MPIDQRDPAPHRSGPGDGDIAGRHAAGRAPEGRAPAPRTDPDRWLAEHGDLMWRYAMVRLRKTDAAEEAIQESLVAALEARSRFRGDCSERTWLMSILRHKIADRLRKGRLANSDAGAMAAMFNERGKWRVQPQKWPADPDQVLAAPEFWRDLEACLADLPPGVGDAFVLCEIRKADTRAVCGALRITAGNLWVRLHRARALLRRCLAGKWAPDREEGC